MECIIYFCAENKCMLLRHIPQLYTIKSERNTAMVTLWQICKCSSQEGSLRLAVLGLKQFEALEDQGSRGSILQLTWPLKAVCSSGSKPRTTSSGLHNPSPTFILPLNSSFAKYPFSEYVLVTGSIIQAKKLCDNEKTPESGSGADADVTFRWSCIVVLSSLVTTLVGIVHTASKS